MSTYLYDFKAAFYLNNAGVSLLERRCYRQALKTLSDALSIMKAASSRLDVSSTGPEAPTLQGKESSTDIQGKCIAAAQRLASPDPTAGEIVQEYFRSSSVRRQKSNSSGSFSSRRILRYLCSVLSIHLPYPYGTC
jgi:hypothetical protein